MTRIWLVNWHFQSRITLWGRHKSTNISMGLCWQMTKFIVWRLCSIYFDHHLPLKPSIGKRRKQSCIPNNTIYNIHIFSIRFLEVKNLWSGLFCKRGVALTLFCVNPIQWSLFFSQAFFGCSKRFYAIWLPILHHLWKIINWFVV